MEPRWMRLNRHTLTPTDFGDGLAPTTEDRVCALCNYDALIYLDDFERVMVTPVLVRNEEGRRVFAYQVARRGHRMAEFTGPGNPAHYAMLAVAFAERLANREEV